MRFIMIFRLWKLIVLPAVMGNIVCLATARETVRVNAAANVYGEVDTRYSGFLMAVPTPESIGPDRFE